MANPNAFKSSLRRAVVLAVAVLVAPTIVTIGGELQGPQTAPAPIRTVPPGYRVGEISVIGARALRSEFIRSAFGLLPGDVFIESRIRKGLEDLKKLYGQLGFAYFSTVQILEFDEKQKVVNVVVEVDEGRQYFVNRITFTGNTTIPDEVIRREISLIEGYVFNSQLLEISLVRLNRLGLFEEIKSEDIRIERSGDQPKVDIQLKLREKIR